MSALHCCPHCWAQAHIISQAKHLKASREGALPLQVSALLSLSAQLPELACDSRDHPVVSFPSEASRGFLLPAELS